MQPIRVLCATVLLCLFAVSSQAATITSFTAGLNTATSQFIGQSLTTPAGDGWSDLSFNFFSDVSGGTTPASAGTLFLLTSEYLGTPSNLSALTPGFLAQSTSIVGNVYFFDPAVTILGGNKYFLYSNASVVLSGSNSGGYVGGDAYFASSAGSNFAGSSLDANFLLQGTAVPEPASILLLGTALLGAGVRRWRQRG